VQSRFVVDSDFLAGLNITKGDEKDVAVENLHERIGLAGMIDVVRTVATPAAIQAPTIIDCTDAQPSPRSSAIGLSLCYSLACILRYFSSPLEVSN
jgi:hypothetical protein